MSPLVEFAAAAGERLDGPGAPVLLSTILDGLEPAVKLLAIRLGGKALLVENPPEVEDLRVGGSSALQSEEPIVLSDP